MWNDIFKEFLDKLYPWHYQVAGAIILAALVLFFWYMFIGVHNFTKSISSILRYDEKMQNLRGQLDEAKSENNRNKTMSDYMSRVIYNIKPLVDSLNEIRILTESQMRTMESSKLMQRIIDALTSDIKYKSGENHRCCVWVIEDQFLRPAVFSAGFPNSYSSMRQLDRDKSIAGRAFRTKQTQNIENVTKDTEWVNNPDSRSKYKSLICIPIGDSGVLTIDGIDPLNIECQNIGELYASLVEGAIQEYFLGINEYQYQMGIENDEDVV